MGENEQTLLENRNIPITDEVREPRYSMMFFSFDTNTYFQLKSVCRVKDVYIYVFFTLFLLIILGFIVCCACIICTR